MCQQNETKVLDSLKGPTYWQKARFWTIGSSRLSLQMHLEYLTVFLARTVHTDKICVNMLELAVVTNSKVHLQSSLLFNCELPKKRQTWQCCISGKFKCFFFNQMIKNWYCQLHFRIPRRCWHKTFIAVTLLHHWSVFGQSVLNILTHFEMLQGDCVGELALLTVKNNAVTCKCPLFLWGKVVPIILIQEISKK